MATDENLWILWAKRPSGPLSAPAALRAIYNLGIEHGQASSREVAEPAPVAGGLVVRITLAIDRAPFDEGDHLGDEARAAIFEVARWLRSHDINGSAKVLEQEAGR